MYYLHGNSLLTRGIKSLLRPFKVVTGALILLEPTQKMSCFAGVAITKYHSQTERLKQQKSVGSFSKN